MSLLHPSSAHTHAAPHAPPSTPHPRSLTHRLRAALPLPTPFQRTAAFRVRLRIHDITNVPLVSGDFSVRWKFRGGKAGGGAAEWGENEGEQRAERGNHAGTTSSTASSASVSAPSPLITSSLAPEGTDGIVPHFASPPSLSSVESGAGTVAGVSDAARRAVHDAGGAPGDVSGIARPSPKAPAREKKVSLSSVDTADTTGSLGSGSTSTSASSLAPKKSLTNLPHLTASATSLTSTSSAASSESSVPSPDEGQSRDTPAASGTDTPPSREVSGGISHKRSGLFGRSKGKSKRRIGGRGGDSINADGSAAQPTHSTERRGTTPVRPLRDHTCTWDFPVTQLVKIGISQHALAASGSRHSLALAAAGETHTPAISRTGSSTSLANLTRHGEHGVAPHVQVNGRRPTHPPPGKKGSSGSRSGPGQLGAGPHSESGLKLVIYQHTPPDADRARTTLHGHGHAHAVVFGVVNLDLAEYASDEAGMGRGGVSRRYLLKQGKTNATIKLTIELEQISGETAYVTPPLQKGQVVAGINVLTGATSSPMDRLAGSLNRLQTPSSTSTSSVSTSGTGGTPNGTNGLANRPASFVGSTASLVSERGATPQPRKVPANHLIQQKGFGGRNKRNSYKVKPSHTHHQGHFASQNNSLSAERVIEAIFNPYPSDVPGPFTIAKQREMAPVNAEEQLLTDEGTDHELTMKNRKPKRPGHFGGHRLKNALEGLRADHKLTSYLGQGPSRDGSAMPPPEALPSVRAKTKAEDWPTDTGKRGWGKKREDSTAPGPIERVPRQLDAETDMPR